MDSGRPRLLVLTPAFPYPPVSGGDIRVFHLLRHLSRTLSIHLLPYTSGCARRLIDETGISAVERRDAADTHSRPWNLRTRIRFWRDAPHGLSLDVDPVYARSLRRVIAGTRFQGVLVDHLYMMQYARFVGPLPVFYSATDVETTKFARWYEGERLSRKRRLLHWAQGRVIRWHESRLGRRAHVTFATSSVDRDELVRINGVGRFVVVPNGVDPSYFRLRSRESFRKAPSVCFVGTMFYRPNYLAARALVQEVFPLIRRELPDATCHLAGKTNDRDYSELHHPEAGVYMHGFVEDIRSHFEGSQVLVTPISVGSGTRIKILEAMATGTPVVSTAIGAEGIDISDGENIVIGKTAVELARAAVGLLRDRERCVRMGIAGRRLVEGRYSWDASGDVMQREILRVLEQTQVAPQIHD